MNRRTVLLQLAGGLGVAAVAPTVAAHPVHGSSAVADLRGQTLEVTLTVTPEDLQEALRRAADRPVHIDDDPAVDALAQAYMRKHFVVAGPKGALPMTWVGSEVESDAAHLYFQFSLPAKPAAVTVRSGVFFDIAPAQINRVQVRRGKASQTFRFRATDRAARLKR